MEQEFIVQIHNVTQIPVDLVKETQFAGILDVSPSAIRNRRISGHCPRYFKVPMGRNRHEYYYSLKDIVDWLQTCLHETIDSEWVQQRLEQKLKK